MVYRKLSRLIVSLNIQHPTGDGAEVFDHLRVPGVRVSDQGILKGHLTALTAGYCAIGESGRYGLD